jgi:hypothetical protein
LQQSGIVHLLYGQVGRIFYRKMWEVGIKGDSVEYVMHTPGDQPKPQMNMFTLSNGIMQV